MTKINTALAGYGSGAKLFHAPFISSLSEFTVSKILTSSLENIEDAKKDLPEAEIVQDYSMILEDPEVDLVVIILPNHLHHSFTKEALEAGKHVLVEKPFTATTAEADELIELAKQKNLILSVNHNRRWDSDFLTIQRLLKEEKLGEIVGYEAHFDRFRKEIKQSWKENEENPGSGILYDLGSHLIDQALTLFGKPSEIFADIRIQREDSKVSDSFHLLLLYPKTRVVLKAGLLVKEKGPRYSVFGSRGSFLKYGMDVQEEALKQGRLPKENPDWGKEPQEIWGKINTVEEEKTVESEAGDYRKLYQNLSDAISGKEELQVKPEQARDAIRVIELAYKSNSEKRVQKFS